MVGKKMHDNEMVFDDQLIKQLLTAQFPQWAELTIKRVASMGTDNALYRLGTDMCIRLPRIPDAARDIEKEHIWLPQLAPHVPLALPMLLGKGKPDENYPHPWSIYRWLEGENAFVEPIDDLNQAAIDLAQFLRSLQQISPTGGPSSRRGAPLITQDKAVRNAIIALHGFIDAHAVTKLWEECLQAPVWDKPAVWIHGDLLPANLLVQHGRLSAVIDFSLFGIGDPACDVIVAWSVLSSQSRDIFRAELKVDDATWMRGRGWALSIALIIIPYYRNSNPELVAVAQRILDEILT